jgi:hypothetical protein
MMEPPSAHCSTLAPLDLFAGVVAPNPSAFRGFDRLAVDHTGTGLASRPICWRAVITSN